MIVTITLILPKTDNLEQHLKVLDELFTRLRASRLHVTARPSKCLIGGSKLDM